MYTIDTSSRRSGKTTRLVENAMEMYQIGLPIAVVASNHKMLEHLLSKFPESAKVQGFVSSNLQDQMRGRRIPWETKWYWDNIDLMNPTDIIWTCQSYYTQTI